MLCHELILTTQQEQKKEIKNYQKRVKNTLTKIGAAEGVKLYEELLSKMPKTIDWNNLIEMEDNVEGVQTLACTAAGCEV